MSTEHRLRRLRELLARIEQLPASSERERMLGEVRARVVDVDTGVRPRAMLPVDLVPTPATNPGLPRARAPKAVASTRADRDLGPRTAAVGLSAAEDRDWLLSPVATHEVLSLDDSAELSAAGEARVGHDRRPWTRGLRG